MPKANTLADLEERILHALDVRQARIDQERLAHHLDTRRRLMKFSAEFAAIARGRA